MATEHGDGLCPVPARCPYLHPCTCLVAKSLPSFSPDGAHAPGSTPPPLSHLMAPMLGSRTSRSPSQSRLSSTALPTSLAGTIKGKIWAKGEARGNPQLASRHSILCSDPSLYPAQPPSTQQALVVPLTLQSPRRVPRPLLSPSCRPRDMHQVPCGPPPDLAPEPATGAQDLLA